ncbi:hypothetical protein HPB52_017915 [Rhipicephalus sanguineus]|uniref:Sidestep protein n=1 Tax=Rhipicephalus sanguineus TaxID=34632 RepID=A0A9D4SUN7_RHISA|nr:hypothetical protein HPB52_017915 [Rhipicephalus sanguineus]
MGHSPAHLQIDSVQEADAGEYRCRVDFRQARSVNTVITLRVIVPPGNPIIMDEEGRKLEGLVRRFSEGQKLRLLCEVEGGKPRPVVTWWRDKLLVDSDFSFVDGGNIARNWLDIAELKRSDYLSVLTCQAANNNGTVAVSRSVTLDINRYLSHLVCSSSGSRPPALLTWWKGGEQLFSAHEHTRSHDDTSSSILHFTPQRDDDGAVLSCRAENTLIPGSAIEHGMKLDILYKPQVLLRLGHNLQEDNIREGGDVYLECEVDANPSASEVTWLFDDDEVITNTSAGVIVSSRSLVLQKVHRSRRGRYACVAINSEGRSTSNIFLLRIKYAPMCKPGQKHMYGASQNDSVSVHCEVEADPVDVTFQWRFDSSVSGKRLELTRFSQKLTRSVALHTTLNEDDFGLLLCWATNEIDRQRKPCAFAVVKAGPPEPVRNCSQDNGTSNSVSFECAQGLWDGGMQPVTFVAELRDADTNRLVANASSTSRPAFSFNDLEEGATFRVVLYTTNPKGHRKPVDFFVSTIRSAETVSHLPKDHTDEK